MQIITNEDAQLLTLPFIGKRINRIWQGNGSAIFFEVGELSDNKGELTVMIEWSWRVENEEKIIFGSFSEPSEFPVQLDKLHGLILNGVSFQFRLPEVVLELSGNIKVCSFSIVEGDPEWALITPAKTLMSSNGNLVIE